MKLFFLVISALILSACEARQIPQFTLPETVGVWKLKSAKNLEATEAPEQVRQLGMKRGQAGDYEGSGKLTAQVFEMTSSAAAFEMEQNWRPLADTVAFHKESYFAVIHWDGAERAAISAFVKELDQRLTR